MPLEATDVGDRWRLMPRREAVVHQVRRKAHTLVNPVVSLSQMQAEGTDPYESAAYEARAVSDAWKRQVTFKEASASQGVYTTSDRQWYFPKELVPDSPAPGDLVTDGLGIDWTILDIAEVYAFSVWQLTCKALAVAFALSDAIDVERPQLSHDAAGAAVRSWRPAYAGLRCRVQLLNQEQADGRGIFGFQDVFNIVVERQLRLCWEDRIKLHDGRYLEIKDYRNPELLSELPTISAVHRV